MSRILKAFRIFFQSWKAAATTFALAVVLNLTQPASAASGLLNFLLFLLVAVWSVRATRWFLRRVLWRVRNRLIISYALIALIPLLLLAGLGGLGIYGATSQVAGFTANQALDRKVQAMMSFVEILQLEGPYTALSKLAALAERSIPGLRVTVIEGSRRYTYPSRIDLTPPPGLPDYGIIRSGDDFFLYGLNTSAQRQVFAVAPLTTESLGQMVPGLGQVNLLSQEDTGTIFSGDRDNRLQSGSGRHPERPGLPDVPATSAGRIPNRLNWFDTRLPSLTERPVWTWEDQPKQERAFLIVQTRPSAIYQLISRQGIDSFGDTIPTIFSFFAVLFVGLAGIAITIGVTLTRSITNAVHDLHAGTGNVMRGDFSHRIEVRGQDQLADLGRSFNNMTENLERLLSVAKEKERLQSELEIAREVQNQLFPRKIPQLQRLRLTPVCNPARLVSGDYYDFQKIDKQHVAVAVGDVSGKGISAALLMATLQASFRTELRHRLEAQQGAPWDATAPFVQSLNRQVWATTPPEKFATFFFGVFDDTNGHLTYTNAGHLPPMLVRDGQSRRLEVNGLIVGAFPNAKYDQSVIYMQPNDLLVCFTDGVTEPENEFGEMVGEDRLQQLLEKNAHKSDDQILELLLSSIEQWTKSTVLQDDITLVLARHI
jgi:sigma-B regulation protein RsbU (phosphoserine phosphatase)